MSGEEKNGMRSMLSLLIVMGCLTARPASADQYAYVTLQQATEAQKVLAKSHEMHEFCAPCGDAASKPMRVDLVEIGRIWEGESAKAYQAGDGETFWEVIVNNQGIDLAYVYVRQGGRWENLALRLGLDASGVPRYLDKHQIGH